MIWNIKLIVNVFRIRGYNAVNLKNGYFQLDHLKKLLIMKTKVKIEKTFDTVKVFRAIKEKIANETEKMNYEQFKAYLKKNQISQVTNP